MGFDPTTAIAVKENSDGLFERVGNFDPTTAKPIPELSADKEAVYTPELTPDQKAQAVVELTYKERGEEVPRGLKADWLLTSPTVKATTQTILAPELSLWLGFRGAIQNRVQFDLMGNIAKGIIEPEKTDYFVTNIPGYDKLPEWAQILLSVGEDFVGVGTVSLGKSFAKNKLLVRNIERRVEQAAESFAKENMANILQTEGADANLIKNQFKSGFKREFIRKATALEAEFGELGTLGQGEAARPSVLQQYAERKGLFSLVAEEIANLGEAGEIRIPKIGESIKFVSENTIKQGIIKSIERERAIIDLEGKEIVAALSQIVMPQSETKGKLVRKYESTLAKDKLSNIEQGIRQGKIKGKAEIKQVQTDLIDIIEESGLEADDRAKFLRLVKNTQTAKQIENILPEVSERISSLIVKQERSNLIDDIKKIFKQPIESISLDYQDQINALKDKIEPRQLSDKNQRKRESMREFVNRMTEQGEEINIPEEHLALLDKVSLDQMSNDDLIDLKTTIQRMYHLGKIKDKLLTAQEDRKFADIVKDGIDAITSSQGLKAESGITRILREQNKSLINKSIEEIKKYAIINLRPELMINMLDNFNTEGINTQVMWNNLWSAQEQEIVGIDTKLTQIREILKNINLVEILGKKYNIGRFEGMTKDSALAIYAYSLNDKGLARLLNTGITEQDIRDITAFLGSKETGAVDNLLRFYDEQQYKELDAVYSELEGVHLSKEQNYFPMDRVEDISYNKELERDILERNYISRAGVAKGMTQKRVDSKKGFSELSFIGTILRNLSKVEHYKAFAPALRDANKYLNNIEIKRSIVQNFGEDYYNTLTKWLKDTAYGGDRTVKQGMEEFAMWLRTNFVTAMIGINISSMLKAPISFIQGMEMAGKGKTMASLADFILHPFKTIAKTESKSGLVKYRFFNQQRELQEIVAERSKLDKITGQSSGLQKIKEISMLPWQIFDKSTVTIVWNGAYQEALADNQTEAQARAFADRVIRRTQPMAGAINLPDVFRSGVLNKLLTTFRNQQNQNFNLGFESIAKKSKNKIGWAKLGADLAFYWLIPAYLIGFITRRKLSNAKELAADTLNQALGGLVLFGNIINGMTTGFMGETTPLEGFSQDIYSALTAKKMSTRVNKILEIAAMSTGIPYVGVKRIVTGQPLGKKKKKKRRIRN